MSKCAKQRVLDVVVTAGGYDMQVHDTIWVVPKHVTDLSYAIECWGYLTPYTPNAKP